MKIGYARVSTEEQGLNMQLQALKQAGCDKIYSDKVSGICPHKPGLEEALSFARDGDTLVVWRLDRLDRSLKELISFLERLEERGIQFVSLTDAIDTSSPGGRLFFHMIGALAEFERNIIRERTKAGLQAARAAGKRLGRREKITQEQWATILPRIETGQMTLSEAARLLGVDKSTVSRRYKAKKGSAT